MAFLMLWTASAASSILLFTVFSLAIDQRVFFSSWVKGALVVMGLFGPLGTLLVLWFLIDTAIASFKEARQQREGRRSISLAPSFSGPLSRPAPLISPQANHSE